MFRDRPQRLTVLRYFPEAARGLELFPTVEQVADGLGLGVVSLEPVAQATTSSLRDKVIRREADTLLRLLTDEEFERGAERLRAAPPGPVIDYLDFLVLK